MSNNEYRDSKGNPIKDEKGREIICSSRGARRSVSKRNSAVTLEGCETELRRLSLLKKTATTPEQRARYKAEIEKTAEYIFLNFYC